MTKKQIYNLVVEKLRSIQEMCGKKIVDINEDTVPIGQLAGFDSLTGIEFTTEIDADIPLDKSVRLCVSVDGKKPLSVRQIVKRLMDICGDSQQGEENGEG
ncbi:MAG: hypothetical protein CEE38_21160 [Planctomycetes bacterium B3_Pla]|nr:MAG: hypothetical protein CEE38_21160 [Planctomycetes bacterium B3_Pla]